MEKEKKYINELMKYYNQSLSFLHEEEKDEWMYFLKDLLPVLGEIMDHRARYIVSAMFYIITTDKDYTFDEQEQYYRKMRVWSKLEDIKLIAFDLVDLLIQRNDEEIDEEALNQLLEVLEGAGVKGIIPYNPDFDMEELYLLQADHTIDKNKITYIESLFFEGRLNHHSKALDIAYTILLIEPYAYHVLIYLMDKIVSDGINEKSIAFLEAFVHSFEEVEEDWIKETPRVLTAPSDLREYCYGLSSIAMFYLEEENYDKAITYYEKLLTLDQENLFHAREYVLRAYMFNNQFDKYSDILESLPEVNVYKRLLTLYRKIQLVEDDLETYLEDTVKQYGYLLEILINENESDTSKLPEIEEDFIIEYGQLFLEDEEVLKLIREFLSKFHFTA